MQPAKRLYQFTAIDDCTRIRMLKIYDKCNQKTAMQFIDEVIRRLPFRILVVQTDNGAEFQSAFHWHLRDLDIQHAYIRPRTPRLNGKVERSHRVDAQEFYQLLDRDGVVDRPGQYPNTFISLISLITSIRPVGCLPGFLQGLLKVACPPLRLVSKLGFQNKQCWPDCERRVFAEQPNAEDERIITAILIPAMA